MTTSTFRRRRGSGWSEIQVPPPFLLPCVLLGPAASGQRSERPRMLPVVCTGCCLSPRPHSACITLIGPACLPGLPACLPACPAAKLNPITLMGDGTAVQHVFVKPPGPQAGGSSKGACAVAKPAAL